MNMDYLILILGLLAPQVYAQVTSTLIQAENMFGSVSEIHRRTNAVGQKSVHLHKGDRIHTELCLTSDTELIIEEIVYSNDGLSDRIQVTLDTLVLGEFKTFMFTDFGRGWNMFKTSTSMLSRVTEGRHILTLTVLESDLYGVEIDFIKLGVNHLQSLASLHCNDFCFDDITLPYSKPEILPSGGAWAIQKSVKTKCAEEDNINIPIFHDNSSSLNFVVSASLPKYNSFLNNRGPDWTDCQMSEAFWKYRHVSLNHDDLKQSRTSRMNITNFGTTGVGGTRLISVIEVDFELEGPSRGSVDSEIGTVIHLEHIQSEDNLEFKFQYYNRYNSWSNIQNKLVKNNESSTMFETPDFSFREGAGNKIRIEVYSMNQKSANISIGHLFMYKRWLKSDRATTLFNDGLSVIEGVDIDMWWRINETMSVTIGGGSQTFYDIDYIRIYRRVPWTEDAFSQVFVLYQDANIRLLPTTPHGLDWIPFGSSVIIGQTDPLSNRPSAPITHLNVDPILLKMTIFYMDGSIVPMQIKTTLSETQLHVSESHFTRDVKMYPFFTFRSMYVSDDNNDADHISVDGGNPVKITEHWHELRGNYFALYRQCISKHNTQSPDISIKITS